tara:strand:+ start:1780 stop:2118 length:339 start_codon:yes stop_codon:yes gene_type:complete
MGLSLNNLLTKIALVKSPKEFFWVLQGNFYYLLYNIYLLPKHLTEQIRDYRALKCSSCVVNGECLKCGCYTLQKLCSDKPDKNYVPFMTRMQWDVYKDLLISKKIKNDTSNR